ncbi:MAG: flagellar protein FlaG [Methylophagaceae bacterium]
MAGNELAIQSILQTGDKKLVSKPSSSDTAVLSINDVQNIQQEQDQSTNGNAVVEATLQQQQQQLAEQVAQLNDYVQHLNRNLQFSVDEQSGQTVVKVIDVDTEELVRQIPSQEIIDARNAADNYRGLLLEAKV